MNVCLVHNIELLKYDSFTMSVNDKSQFFGKVVYVFRNNIFIYLFMTKYVANIVIILFLVVAQLI